MRRSSSLTRRTPLKRTSTLSSAGQKVARGEDRGVSPGRFDSGRRRPISPASKAQRDKVRDLPCLNCGRDRYEAVIDPAHLVPRSAGGCDDPLCVIPLCRSCHRAQHDGHLDLLPLLEPHWRAEIAHAVMHVGLERVRVLTAPSAYREAA